MQKHLIAVLALLFSVAPLLGQDKAVTVDFSGWNAPGLEAYQANAKSYLVTFQNAGAAWDLTGKTPIMWWAVSNSSPSVVTAAVSVVSATGGVIRATFSPTDLNTYGTFIYGCSVVSGNVTTARIGQFVIRRDPYATGGSPVNYGTNLNWGLYRFLGMGSGPYIAGAGITVTTNANGGQTWAASAGTSYTFANTNLAAGVVVTNGSTVYVGTNVAASTDDLSWQARTNDWNSVTGKASVAQLGGYLPTSTVYVATEADTNALSRLAAHSNLVAFTAHPGTGSAATNATDDFATAAQGLLAASALQSEADTLQTVVSRGSTNTTDILMSGCDLIMSSGSIRQSSDNSHLSLWGGLESVASSSIGLYGSTAPSSLKGTIYISAGTNTTPGYAQIRFMKGAPSGTKLATLDASGMNMEGLNVSNATYYGDASNLTNITPAQVVAAGGLITNTVTGTNSLGTIWSAGQVQSIGTLTPWVASQQTGYDLTPQVSGTNVTIYASNGAACYLSYTTNMNYLVGADFSTNAGCTVEISVQPNTFSSTFGTAEWSNTVSISTGTTWQSIIFHRPYRGTVFTGVSGGR